jgi:DNA helicase-2/ATP-dependent DNA helicase PcrA
MAGVADQVQGGGRDRVETGADVGTSRAEATQPAAAAAVDENQDSPRYVKGERVTHRRFGGGTIKGLSGGGKDLKVAVTFDDPDVGDKQLLVAFAGLEREWESA